MYVCTYVINALVTTAAKQSKLEGYYTQYDFVLAGMSLKIMKLLCFGKLNTHPKSCGVTTEDPGTSECSVYHFPPKKGSEH